MGSLVCLTMSSNELTAAQMKWYDESSFHHLILLFSPANVKERECEEQRKWTKARNLKEREEFGRMSYFSWGASKNTEIQTEKTTKRNSEGQLATVNSLILCKWKHERTTKQRAEKETDTERRELIRSTTKSKKQSEWAATVQCKSKQF